MTANELQRIATRIGNSCWCRHWLHFNWPQNPCVMAIQAMDWGDFGASEGDKLMPRSMPELEKLGFKLSDDPEHKYIYVIDRTNEDGLPFISRL